MLVDNSQENKTFVRCNFRS